MNFKNLENCEFNDEWQTIKGENPFEILVPSILRALLIGQFKVSPLLTLRNSS